MWSCLLIADSGSETLNFSGLTVLPANEIVDALGQVETRHVLVAAPAALAEAATLQITIAAGSRPDVELATLISEHAPLAVMSAVVSARAAVEQPALAVGLVRQLLAHSWSGAWTPTVSRLARPTPSLRQHLRSLLPGAGFWVRQGDDPQVLGRVPRQGADRADHERVLLVQEGAVPSGVVDQLGRWAGASTVRPVRMPGRWESVYGTSRAGQVAVLPAQSAAFLPASPGRCPACGLDQSVDVCPFCRVLIDTTTVGGHR